MPVLYGASPTSRERERKGGESERARGQRERERERGRQAGRQAERKTQRDRKTSAGDTLKDKWKDKLKELIGIRTDKDVCVKQEAVLQCHDNQQAGL